MIQVAKLTGVLDTIGCAARQEIGFGETLEIERAIFADRGIEIPSQAFADWLTRHHLRMVESRSKRFVTVTHQMP